MTTEELLHELLTTVQEHRLHPYGPVPSPTDEKVAGAALVRLCGGDKDKARTLWKLIASDFGYMPRAACVAVIRAADPSNLVPDVTPPEPS